MKIRIHRPLYLKYSLAFLFLHFVGFCYRRVAYNQGASNFLGIADYYPNILAGPIVVFFNLSMSLFKSEKEEIGRIKTWIESLVIYEFLQMLPIVGQVFDWRDVLGSFLGGALVLVIYRRTNKSIDPNANQDFRVP